MAAKVDMNNEYGSIPGFKVEGGYIRARMPGIKVVRFGRGVYANSFFRKRYVELSVPEHGTVKLFEGDELSLNADIKINAAS